MAKLKVKQYDKNAPIEWVMDSDVSIKLVNGYKALVTEVTDENGNVEGTILYIPGINYKTYKKA